MMVRNHYDVEHEAFRDAFRIFAGTSEVMKVVIAKDMMGR